MKCQRTNSTFGFLPTRKYQLEKTKRAIFFADAQKNP